MNTICRLFLEQQKALELFCLFPATIIVGLLISFERKLTATSHSKVLQVCICFMIDPSIGHAGGHSMGKYKAKQRI